MSATATPAPAPLTGEQAEAALVRDIFAPAFFDKLAAHGRQPRTEQEAVTALRMGQKLLAAHREEQVKAAGVRATGVAAAEAALDRELHARYGFPPTAQEPAEVADYLDKSAEALGANPAVQEALDAYTAALAAAGN